MFIFLIGAVAVGVLGTLAYFGLRTVDKVVDTDSDEKQFQADKAKLDEWAAAAQGHDARKAKEDALMQHECYAALRALRDRVDAQEERRMYVLVHVENLEEYRKFSAMRWAREHMDKDEILDILALSDHMLESYRKVQGEMDRLCVEALDCPDEDVRMACNGVAARILNILSVDLCIGYECPPENGHTYHNVQGLTRNDLRLIAGMEPEGGRDINDIPAKRHDFLWENGYRCRRCGGSALTGSRLSIAEVPGGMEALCQNCREGG